MYGFIKFHLSIDRLLYTIVYHISFEMVSWSVIWNDFIYQSWDTMGVVGFSTLIRVRKTWQFQWGFQAVDAERKFTRNGLGISCHHVLPVTVEFKIFFLSQNPRVSDKNEMSWLKKWMQDACTECFKEDGLSRSLESSAKDFTQA